MNSQRAFACLIFFPVFLFAGFYLYHLLKYPSDKSLSERLNYLRSYHSEELLMKAGYVSPPEGRMGHFLKFPVKKERGAVRIGAFGDSFTFGDEVHGNASWPAQLQTLLNDAFPSQKIEVLNFGASGHSFQQQFFLWEQHAESYGLDYILYGPRGFFSDRQVTFGKPWEKAHPFSFPSDRFILSGKQRVQRIRLKGKDLEERYKNYYSLIPSRTALRYDRWPFKVWESYFPFLKEQLNNPFYYSDRTAERESADINQIVLRKMQSRHNKKIFVLTGGKEIENYTAIKQSHNLNYFTFLKDRFFYRALGHAGALGNGLISHAYFNALTGKKNFFLNILGCHFRPQKENETGAHPDVKIDFNTVRRIHIGTRDLGFGELRINSPDHHILNSGEFLNHKNSMEIKSFVGFSGSSIGDFGSSPYLPLPFELKPGAEVRIQFAKEETVLLGKVSALDAFGKFFNLYVNYLDYNIDFLSTRARFITAKLPPDLKQKLTQHSGKKTLLKINDAVIGELLPEKFYEQPHYTLNPKMETDFLMMGPLKLLRERDLPSRFPLYIHYVMKDDRVLKSLIPDWTCKKKKQKYSLSLPNFEPLKFK